MPDMLNKQIRYFARCLEPWTMTALEGFPDLTARKLEMVRELAHVLRRYTSLNHLAGAARPVLANVEQTKQMVEDISCIDFAEIQAQSRLVSDCDGDRVVRLQQEFGQGLETRFTIEQWAEWLQGIVKDYIGDHANPSKKGRHFLTRWSFYTSMVLRDLTLRSAASFGSFHLLRLLCDEYVMYLVEEVSTKVRGPGGVPWPCVGCLGLAPGVLT